MPSSPLRTAVIALGLLLVATAARGAEPSVVSEFVAPADAATQVWHADDDRLFILERAGTIRVFVPGQGLLPTPFLDLTTKVTVGGEMGLFAIAFHPAYASNGFFFVSYIGAGMTSTIARYHVSANPNVADPASETIVFTLNQTAPTHKAGQIAFGPDGNLWLSFGDGGGSGDTECRVQHGQLYFGKIIRINVDALPYTIPSDNPFVGANDPLDLVADEVWATGLRNPWRFSFDRGTGDLLIGDVGQDSREEVDYEPAGFPGGRNYGWKVMEGDKCHDPDPIDEDCPPGTPSCFDPAYTPPVYTYPHGGLSGACAVIGGFVYRGSAIPDLVGRYVFGDNCVSNLWTLEKTGPGTWGNLKDLVDIERPLRSLGEDTAGELYVASGSGVYKLVPGDGRRPQSRVQQACLNAMNGKASGVASARSRNDAMCIDFAGRRQLANLGLPAGSRTVAACMATDVRGRVATAVQRLTSREASTCLNPARPEQMPNFGYAPSAQVGAAGIAAGNRLTHALFGADPDDALVFADQNATGAHCQAEAAKRIAAVLEGHWKAALRGKRLALLGQTGVQPAGFASELAASVLASVDVDAKNLVGSKQAKLVTGLAAKCGGQSLAALFPGDCAASAGTLSGFAACLRERVRCHFCRSFERADALTANCDTFDDGAADASCPSETEVVCATSGPGVNWAAVDFDCPRLSQYRLFADPTDPTENAVGGIPYDLTTPLFSDYAQKYRFAFLPPGTHATYDADAPFPFPAGAIISKTFAFAHDLRNLALGEDVIETRLLLHRAGGWEGLPYVWLPDMSDAVLTPEGASVPVAWIDAAGAPRSTDYEVPTREECGFCHFGSGDDPIGPKARLLNRPYPYATGTANQIDHWTAIGALTGAPPSASAPRLPVWNDPSDGTLETRARAYLETNCAHCHNPLGRAGFTGLTFLHDQPLDQSYGICAEADDGGGGSGLTFAIVPGAADQSVVHFRMGSVTDGVKMPQLERSVVHTEGAALVDAWIDSLAGACP
jgi:uncharacterized repeat protein (TIGR03806 family)